MLFETPPAKNGTTINPKNTPQKGVVYIPPERRVSFNAPPERRCHITREYSQKMSPQTPAVSR